MRTLHTHLTIAAPPSRVWEVLVDLDAYPQWNPLVRRARGELREGARLDLTLHGLGTRPFRVRPRLLRVEPARELRWLGRLGLPGVFDGEHVFRLEPEGEGTRLVHQEHFRGALVPFLWARLRTETRVRFEAMNEALRDRAERARRTPRGSPP